MKIPDDDELPEWRSLFDPRMGRRGDSRADVARGQLWRFLRRGRRRAGNGGGGTRRCTVAVRQPSEQARRCVVKGRYVTVYGQGSKTMKLHLAYLERDGVERDGSPGRLYGAEGGIDAETFGAPVVGERRQFRFIVSPEDGELLDLTGFARRFMSQVETDLGRKLVWAAVNHHDTDNPHVHIIIRGVDRDGDDVRIDGRYIAREMRWRAQEIVTKELGPRLESEIAQLRKWEIAREGLGRIDQTLASCLSVDRVVSLAVVARMPREVRTACLARLETLSRMQLAQKEPRGMWRLVPEWKELLTRMQIGSDVRGRLYRHIPASLGQGVTLEPSQGFATLEGIIRGIGLHDELGGAMYLAVQDAGGAAYYVQVRPEVAEGFRVGDKVRISRPVESWTKSTDRIIARFALQNGGVYDPVGHERALMALGSREVGGALVSAQDLVRANVRRLERLEKYGLAQRLPAGRWHIPADLVGQLEARERTHPRHRIQIERLGQDRDVDRSAAERPMGRRRGPDRSR